MTHLILIRHGESEANLRRQVVGASSCRLTPRGCKQVKTLRQLLETRVSSIDAVITSDTVRTRQTTQILFPHAAVIVDNRLNEIDAGTVTSWPRSKFDAAYPHFFKQFRASNRFPGGESHLEMFKRQIQAFKTISEQYTGRKQTVVVVCHAGTISSLFHHCFRIPLGYYSRFTTANASLSEIKLHQGLTWPQLIAFNQTP